MENTEDSQASSGAPKSTSSKRRIWSPEEDEALILCLKQIIEQGWKCENGFRTGYQKAIEKLLKKIIPNTDLKANHIKNKIHVWKKQNASLQSMLGKSGFEWDDNLNIMVLRNEDVWEEYVKVDTHAKAMKNKRFPFFKDWADIFGKDRAIGEFQEDLNDAAVDPLQEHGETNENNAETDGASYEFDFSIPTNAGGSTNVWATTSGKKKKGKKRSIHETIGESMVNLMGKFCDQTNENLQAIGKRIGYEFSLKEKRDELYEALGKLGVLTADQQIVVAKMLISDNKNLELFFTLPDEARARMATLMLTCQI